MTRAAEVPGRWWTPPARWAGSWDAHRHTVLRLVRYSAVSVVSTSTSLVTLAVLVGLVGTPAVAANVVATAVGTVPSFELNRRWVWRAGGRRSVLRQVVPFCVLSATGLVVSTVSVGLASARTLSWGHWAHTTAVLVANVAAYGSLWVVQYALLDRVLFRSGSGARPPVGPDGTGPAATPRASGATGHRPDVGTTDGARLVGAVSGSSGPDRPHPPGRGW